ncbi:uncharacterized protein [Aquarana catesbeiana]|uniref:uncharacterized protein n=1 Tax=Aquarana catesbeiana TaxID=8400 RepID=UPI003CCA1283
MANREELVQFYFRLGFNNKEILAVLASHNIVISYRTLKRICSKFSLYRKKNFSNLPEVFSFLQAEIFKSGQMQGYRWLHLRALQKGFVVTQKTIRQMVKYLDPEGVQLRTARRLHRRRYHTEGPNAVWHVDSYDKLKPYGIAINGCIDGYSRYIVWMEAFTTNSNPKIVANYFIDAVSMIGGCPERIRADLGTENGHMEQMQKFLRRSHSDNWAAEKSFLYGRSTANQRIERWWGVLRKQNVQFWINLLRNIQNDGYFTGDFIDKNLIQFCFLNIIQAELDEVVYIWNSHNMRKCKRQDSSGGRPILLYLYPETRGTVNRIMPVDADEVAICKEECLPKGRYSCDETVFELCCLIMEENSWNAPEDPYSAVDLYLQLRNNILQNL